MSAARGFPLGCVVVEMGDQANAKRVGGIESFNDAQITGNFGQAFPKPQTPIVHSQGVRVKITFPSCSVQHFQVIHSHLQDLSFF